MTKTDVASAKQTAVGENFDYGDMSHAGFEDTTIADLSIPFLALLQSLSPQVEDQTIENCKAGDMLNTVTGEIVKQPFMVIPVYKEESWVRWRPRNAGGGLQGRYEPDSPEVKALIKANGGSRIPPKGSDKKTIPFKDEDGNDVIETHYVYCLVLGEDKVTVEGYIVVPFSSTKIRVYKDWLTAMYTQKGRPPMFANRAAIETTKQKSEGGSYFNFLIKPAFDTWRESLINPQTDMALLTEAKEFAEMIENGLARPDYDSVSGGSGDDTGGGSNSSGGSGKGGNKNADIDEEMPF